MNEYNLIIENGKSNRPYAKVKYYDYELQKDVQLYLCSKINPEAEAKRWSEALYDDHIELFFIYGLGLGYHLKALLSKMKPYQKLFVLEVNTEVQEKLNHYSCLTAEEYSKMNILCTARLDDACYFIQCFLNQLKDQKYCIELYPSSLRLMPNEFKELREILENYQSRINTCSGSRDEILVNYKAHEKKHYENVSKFYNSFYNKPIIIVSGGPSLDKNVELLKNANDNVFIFSTGRTLKLLVEKEIRIDMFCIIDAKPWIYKQIEGVEDLDTPFVFLNTVREDIVSRYNGPKYIAYSMDSPKDQEGRIESGGSVATAMMDLAIRFGGNPIIFIGQDLAHTHLRSHCQNDMGVKMITDGSNLKKVKDIEGNYIPTSGALLSFKRWIEQKIIKHPSRRYINATEGGAYIEGCEHSTLLDVLLEFKAISHSN